jgi:hypothetical protein
MDQRAIAAVEAALTRNSVAAVPVHSWSSLVTAGPDASLTSSGNRPAADWADAQPLVDVDELGTGPLDTLVVHPQELKSLRKGCGDQVPNVLEAAGIRSVRKSLRVTAGTAYLVASGKAGRVAFDRPLTTEVIDDRHHRSTFVQSYAVPAFTTNVPGVVRKITGVA